MTSLMHEFLEPREPMLVASEFYMHPYGGIARDVHVSPDGFNRFFGLKHGWEGHEYLPRDQKVFPTYITDDVEAHGTVDRQGRCWITFIDKSWKAKVRFHNQECRRLGNEFIVSEEAIKRACAEMEDLCNPHGIPRPVLN